MVYLRVTFTFRAALYLFICLIIYLIKVTPHRRLLLEEKNEQECYTEVIIYIFKKTRSLSKLQ